jgi:hypothetical protein
VPDEFTGVTNEGSQRPIEKAGPGFIYSLLSWIEMILPPHARKSSSLTVK